MEKQLDGLAIVVRNRRLLYIIGLADQIQTGGKTPVCQYQKAGRVNTIDVPALSAKPPFPVQIRAPAPKFSCEIPLVVGAGPRLAHRHQTDTRPDRHLRRPGGTTVGDPLFLVTSTVGRRQAGPLWTIKQLAESGAILGMPVVRERDRSRSCVTG